MIRRGLEWFGGSALVYVLVAACSAADLPEKMMPMGDGDSSSGDAAGDGDGDSIGTGAGPAGDGDQKPMGDGDGDMMAQGDGDQPIGDGDSGGSPIGDGNGDTGGMMGMIMDPVPHADAAEDGSRIVNLYRTTPDGLKAAQDYLFWDKELGVQCAFQMASDGKERCLPPVSTNMAITGAYFTDASCTQKAAIISKEYCTPDVAYGSVSIGGSSCIPASAGSARYQLGAKSTNFYTMSGDDCVENPAFLDTYDVYMLGPEIPPNTYAEGALVQEGG